MHNLSFVFALSWEVKSLYFDRPKTLNFITRLVIRVGGVCRFLQRGVILSIPNCQESELMRVNLQLNLCPSKLTNPVLNRYFFNTLK